MFSTGEGVEAGAREQLTSLDYPEIHQFDTIDTPPFINNVVAVLRFRGYIYGGACAPLAWSEIMVREDGKRNFALRNQSGEETSVFSGNTPRQAALKAARRLDPAQGEANASKTELRLREKGTDKVHIYDGWAWNEEAPDDKPDWMPTEITEANVSKKRIEHLEE